MPQIKPEYEVIEDFRKIAVKLVDKFPELFNGINPNEIRAVGITNKETKDDKEPFEVKPVPMPIRMDCPYSYYIVFNMQFWVGMDREHQQVQVLKALCRVSPDNDGKVLPYDLKDTKIVVRNFGVDYMKTKVPDILSDDYKLKTEEL